MSLNPEIRDQAYQFFIEEAQELLQVLEDGLLHLQEDHSTPKVHELMRAAHSIKGGAASVELDGIKKLAHRLEDFFKALYSDKVEFDEHLESLFLQGYDCLRNPLNEQIDTGAFDEEAALAAAEPIFEQLAEILAEALQEGESYIPSATDLGVDIVASIFEIDVAQSLDHLEQVLANPQDFNIAQELQTQIDVLAGFAELFNLSGFNEIIELVNQALAQNSEQALEITQILVRDCQSARTAILEGDRDRGGEPSPELLTLASNDSLPVNDQGIIEAGVLPLDDVFGDDSYSFDAIATSEEEATLSDIFGVSKNFTESAPQDLTSEGAEPLPAPSLDDVFGDPEGILASTESEISGSFDDADPEAWDSMIFQHKPLLGKLTEASLAATSDLDNVFGSINSQKETSLPDIPSEIAEFAPPENLEAAVQSVGEIFDRLPEIEAVPINTPELYPPSSLSPAKSTPHKQASLGSNLTVRVDLDRLERMNNLIGELVINRNSLSLQNEQLQSNVQDLMAKFTSFRALTSNLREFSDQLLVETEKSPQNSFHLSQNGLAEFDSLEMDSYSKLHLLLQEILEEILQLEEGVDDIALFAQQSDRTINSQRQMLGQMRDEMMWARMLPLEQILKRFPRTLRDLSNKYRKPVDLKMIGTGVLVDKAVLEKLYDPLLHLLRNAFDHGIERADLRQQRRKPETGQIEIHAYYQGNQTVIEIRDDGEGLNVQKIAKKAIQNGMISPAEVGSINNESLFNLIFEPGFSTAEKVSEVSGRGVGMNVVRSQIESLKGNITVHSISGQGTAFTLRLPLTLTIAKLLVFSLSETAFAIPSDSISEIIIPLPEQLKLSGNQRFLFWEENLVPIYSLDEILQYNCSIATNQTSSKAFESVAAPEDWALPLLVLRRGQKSFALEIKRLISEQELVIKPFSQVMKAPPYTYGCTILGDGTLIPVLNGMILIDEFLGVADNVGVIRKEQAPNLDLEQQDWDSNEATTQSSMVKLKTIMVVDDSTALRRTMALSLEKQGYKVFQAKDGRDAVEQFRKIVELDLIVCDIEMPNMNGFEFLGVRRRDSSMKEVPVIMLTSRSGNKHRNLATQLGADGYFTKPYVEQEFLKELKNILSTQKNKSSKLTSTTSKILNKVTILIIDDSSSLRRTMTLSLENQGYRVLQARDGQEGLAQMRNNPDVALAICDIEMPNINGFELLTARLRESNLREIPVAILSSRSGEKNRNLANQLGANAYFSKPYVEKEFLSRIKNLIKTKQ
ncbi:chemotaxis protein histidine kinase-like protein [Xenococcus sp. PCC 7305]|uniref:hybrid sensor histidine kinase/response regulator n=1 Tax=Xenococcus sp. PCC 7305 TaxID=102125 RepID=UPI0002AC9735|nr:hybrid sensor histidine kinase/response regulator [Xenococcus sp. PCC 7305]ELS01052.1 chemotaxis protein histidine kinase-like protein [Xenococcus sp. PCC 7305]